MGSERSKNSLRNIIWAFINKSVILIFPFAVRTVLIQKLGAEYLGLSSLFTSILQMLSLAELGFGSAVVFSLYKPVAERDTERICALVNLYKKIYRVVGIIILCLGLMIMPFLNSLIKGGYPNNINIYIVYLIQLFNTVFTYFLFAYKSVLLIAHQRSDITSKVNSVVYAIQYLAQIIVLLVFSNYYAYAAMVLFTTITNNIAISILVDKKYPQYIAKGKVDLRTKKTIKRSVCGLLISKICQTTRNSLDSIFLSAFMGLDTVAIYTNYYSIMNAVFNIARIVATSITSSIGNSIVSEDVTKNYVDMRKFNFMFMIMIGWATACLTNLYQPFMRLWMGEQYMLPFSSVILFSIYFYALGLGVIRSLYSDAAGLWWANKYRAIAETIANIILNFVLGKLFGVNGIIMATLISLLIINFGIGSNILFKQYFKNHSVLEYFKDHFIYAVVTLVVILLSVMICNTINGDAILEIGVRGFVCIIVPPFVYWVVYRKTKIYELSKGFVLGIVRKNK